MEESVVFPSVKKCWDSSYYWIMKDLKNTRFFFDNIGDDNDDDKRGDNNCCSEDLYRHETIACQQKPQDYPQYTHRRHDNGDINNTDLRHHWHIQQHQHHKEQQQQQQYTQQHRSNSHHIPTTQQPRLHHHNHHNHHHHNNNNSKTKYHHQPTPPSRHHSSTTTTTTNPLTAMLTHSPKWPRPFPVFLLVLLSLLATPITASYDVCSDGENDLLLPCQPSILDAANLASLSLTLDPDDATCGSPPSTYQRLGDRDNVEYQCNAASTTGDAHPLTNIVDTDKVSWWQSVSLSPGTTDLNINVTVSFKKLFRFAGDVILTFNSGRPEKMVLEKSEDHGVTWSPLQFYARNCEDYEGQVDLGATVTAQNPTVVICTNRNVELKSQPRPGGRVTFDLNERFELFLGPTLTDYASYYQALDTLMMDFLIFSDLRFRFIRPASDGRGNFDEYYYAIQDLNVMARCFCNLHASTCINGDEGGLVCQCQHNTQGVNCQECLPLYNERPWQRGSYLPYNEGKANECTMCECNDHADSCTYDGDYGRGVCNACQHNTRGRHCEDCLMGFFPNISTTTNDPQRCLACDCNTLGVDAGNSVCAQQAAPPAPIGQCVCKAQVTGRQCDSCVPGFYGLLEEPDMGSCTACECNLDGTEGQSNRCGQSGGQCPCKGSITGRQCDTCKDGYYRFPTDTPQEGCMACECNEGGSTSLTCDKTTGTCSCKEGIGGDKCDRSDSGSYVVAIDNLISDPTSASPNCDVTSDEYTDAAPFDGTTFASCDVTTTTASTTFDFPGAMIQAALQWPYYPAIRYTNKNSDSITGKITFTYQGDTTQPLSPLSERLGEGISPGCPGGSPVEREITLTPGTSTAIVLTDNPVTLDGRCKLQVTLTLNPLTPATKRRRKRQANPNENMVQVDSVSLLPALATIDGNTALTLYTSAEDKESVVQAYQSCLNDVAVLTSRDGAMVQAPCDRMLFAVVADIYGGASACDCDDDGSQFPSLCASLGGQCTCRTGVGGRACDRCHEGYFNFSASGCQACQCYAPGSQHGACDVTTGQCPCLANVMTLAVENNNPIARTCGQCLDNFYGIDGGEGCSACSCDSQGSTSLQCDDQGQCPCKDSVQGIKCDVCKPGFYGFGPEGCSACNCSDAGSTAITCDQTAGTCDCKENAQGDKCDECKAQMFNLAAYNPKGCQPCFCFGHGQGCESATGFVSQSKRVFDPSPTSDPSDLAVLFGQRHTSYGTVLSLGVRAEFSLIIEGEPLVTLQGKDMSVFHSARVGTTLPRDATLDYQVRLLEGEWKRDVDGVVSDVTALDLMGVLADLSDITVLTRSQGQDLTVTYFEMELSEEINDPQANALPPIMSVEQCTCIPTANVAGLSCEDCATGFRRPVPSGGESAPSPSSLDTCEACDCNSRGATDPPECDALTGVCLNCRNGTTGDQCESCSNHVTGDDCDTCLDEYWGISEAGCQECLCASPGSTSAVCDKDTGQCACALNVAGRTCDKCEENFQGLTASGCTECEQCYSLLKEGVGELRVLRDTLAQEVPDIQERDASNPSTQPFSVRFREAEDNTNKLITFLDSAEASENEVKTQLASLDQALSSIESQLTTIENATLPQAQTDLLTAEAAIARARQHRANLENNARTATNKLDVLDASSETLSNLADDLAEVKDILQGIADASTADREILAQLEALNNTVHTSNTLANQVLEKAQAALEVQKNTTGEILTLETRIIALENQASKTSSAATSLGVQSQETTDSVSSLQRNLAVLSAFSVDMDGLRTRSEVAAAVTQQRNTQMTSSQESFQDIKVKAEATVQEVSDLTSQSNDIGTRAADWISRSRKAEEQAQLISQRADFIFRETEATLALLNDFDNRAKEVEEQANAKLEEVSSVHELSQQLIEDSQALTASLASLQQTAANAKESSGQAKTAIQTKLTRIEGVEREARELETQLAAMDPGGADRLQSIETTKTNVVAPGESLCDVINDDVTVFNAALVTTDTVTENTLGLVGNATERASAILRELRALETVDSAAAQALLAQVTEARSGLRVEELTATINGLVQFKEDQRKDIDSLKAAKDSIQEQVDNLKTLLQQIRPATANSP